MGFIIRLDHLRLSKLSHKGVEERKKEKKVVKRNLSQMVALSLKISFEIGN